MATQDVDQLVGFDEAVRVFRESSWHIHGPLVTEDLAGHTLRARASQTARDVYVFCQTFRVLYFRWKKARNRVKVGTNFSTYGRWNELGIQFTTFIPEGGGISVDVSAKVGLSDIVEALEMSARLHAALKEQAATTADLLRGGSKG